jgi:hypothetical protein
MNPATGQRGAGITVVPQEGTASTEIDQQLEQLRAVIVEIDTQINAAAGS